MSLTRQIWMMLRKELLTEWRQRSRATGIFFFALACVLMVAFSTPETAVLPRIAGGVLWLALLLASTRSLDQSYAVELEHGALEGLLLWPVEPIAVFYGKAIANTLLLFGVALAVFPFLVAVYSAQVKGDLALLAGVVFFGCAALAAPGTLFAYITSQARGSAVILPLMLFPLVVPALLAAANATVKIFEGDPMGQAPSWLGVIVIFDLLHWSLSGVLYGRLMEDGP